MDLLLLGLLSLRMSSLREREREIRGGEMRKGEGIYLTAQWIAVGDSGVSSISV